MFGKGSVYFELCLCNGEGKGTGMGEVRESNPYSKVWECLHKRPGIESGF